ncbi:MAG: ABC transporter substrate-binding protein [Alphaproteobacteria bacterium]|nr:ABC transporter substrate-binding protein [Alphaproteobacteria bacterium]
MSLLTTRGASVAALVLVAAIAAPGGAAAQSFGTVTVGHSTDVTGLNPTQNTQKYQRRVWKHVFDSLMAYDVANNTVPVLAERWEQVDPNTWRFHLRRNVKFTNGEPFTAEAIKVALVANQTQPSRNAGAFSRVFQEAKVVNENTIDLVTKAPYAWVLPMIGDTLFAVPPKYYQEVGVERFGQEPVGTGAYKLEAWRKGDRVILAANGDFWRGKPKADKVVFWAIPDDATRASALINGEADVIAGIPPSQVERIERSGKATIVAGPSSAQPVWIGMMTNRAPFTDARVRQAVNYAVNKQALIDKLLRGYGKVTSQACAQDTVCYTADVKPYPYDPERAKKLLAEAGVSNPTVSLQASSIVPLHKEVSLAVAQDLKAVGINVNVIDEEWSQMSAKLFNVQNGRKDAGDMFLIYAAAGPDVEMLQPDLYGSKGIFNWNFYANDRLDGLFRQAEGELDLTKRTVLFKEINEIINRDAPKLFLYEPLALWGVSSKYAWKADPGDFFYAEDLQRK